MSFYAFDWFDSDRRRHWLSVRRPDGNGLSTSYVATEADLARALATRGAVLRRLVEQHPEFRGSVIATTDEVEVIGFCLDTLAKQRDAAERLADQNWDAYCGASGQTRAAQERERIAHDHRARAEKERSSFEAAFNALRAASGVRSQERDQARECLEKLRAERETAIGELADMRAERDNAIEQTEKLAEHRDGLLKERDAVSAGAASWAQNAEHFRSQVASWESAASRLLNPDGASAFDAVREAESERDALRTERDQLTARLLELQQELATSRRSAKEILALLATRDAEIEQLRKWRENRENSESFAISDELARARERCERLQSAANDLAAKSLQATAALDRIRIGGLGHRDWISVERAVTDFDSWTAAHGGQSASPTEPADPYSGPQGLPLFEWWDGGERTANAGPWHIVKRRWKNALQGYDVDSLSEADVRLFFDWLRENFPALSLQIASPPPVDCRWMVSTELDELQAKAAQWDAVQRGLPMLLWCPSCGERHIDEGEFATKPHHTHACQSCGLNWRPALVPTVGVRFLPWFKNDG